MNGKGFRSSQIAIAIATSLAVGGPIMSIDANAKGQPSAIVGTGADAIVGTGADAIVGTGRSKSASTNAIVGTGKGAKNDAIVGTGKGAKNDAIVGTGRSMIVLMGAVDSVDVSTKTISVLNRKLQIESPEKISEALASGQQLVVAVFGELTTTGTIEHGKLKIFSTDYVPGAAKVVVGGRVSEVNGGRGTVVISGQEIDINSTVLSKPINVGDVVIAVGTQPGRNGAVLAELVY